MTPLQIAATAFALLTGIVGGTIAVESRYEKQATANQVHELLAQESESARLATQLELLKIRLEKYLDLSRVRPLSESEQIELRSVEKERDIILQRMAQKG